MMLARIAIAGVWLHEGLWCKLLGRAPDQLQVMRSVPVLGRWAPRMLLAVGLAEVGLGLWSLSGRNRRPAAAAQTALLVTMSAGGLLWGRRAIPDRMGMVTQNLALLALIWRAAQ